MEEEDWEISFKVVWVSLATYLVFLMQLGFAFLEAGSVRFKNIQSILFKNCVDICTDSISWWFVGYAFAYGNDVGGFIGSSNFLTLDFEDDYEDYLQFLYQWAFAGTSATIVSGCVAERMPIWGYISFSMFSAGWIYPLIVHWTWGGGWLSRLGFKDFAGSGIVHVTGGFAGLIATYHIGPRLDRYNEGKRGEFKANNTTFVVLGTLVLWFAWYGFNGGSTLGVSGVKTMIIPLVGINTTLAAIMSAMTSAMLHYQANKKSMDMYRICYSTTAVCNGALSGLVAVTCSCNNIKPYSAILVGILAGIVYHYTADMLNRIKLDDPLDASSIHFFCGSLGVLMEGFFDQKTGLFFGGNGEQLTIQTLGLICIMGWVFVHTLPIMMLFGRMGLLREIQQIEEIGMDAFILGGSPYTYQQKVSEASPKLLNLKAIQMEQQ